MNPTYSGRKEPTYQKFDAKCDREIKLEYKGVGTSDVNDANHDLSENIVKGQFCLITINNFSGKTHKVTFKTNENADKLRLFTLDNTDEIWTRTLVNMAADNLEFGTTDKNQEFEILSGTGKGIYTLNMDPANNIKFEAKIL